VGSLELIVLCVLYPSGTDFRMRMPTVRSEDWISWERCGDDNGSCSSRRFWSMSGEEDALVKNEVIGG
jgi:hypothetical protein